MDIFAGVVVYLLYLYTTSTRIKRLFDKIYKRHCSRWDFPFSTWLYTLLKLVFQCLFFILFYLQWKKKGQKIFFRGHHNFFFFGRDAGRLFWKCMQGHIFLLTPSICVLLQAFFGRHLIVKHFHLHYVELAKATPLNYVFIKVVHIKSST